MPQFLIDDLSDPRLDPYRDLTRTNLTRWSGLFVAEGMLVVQRLVQSTFEVVSVLVSEHRHADVETWMPLEVVQLIVPRWLAEQLVGFNFHAGVLACARRKPALDLGRFVDGLSDADHTIVVCPNLTGPENLGSILRTAHSLGASLLMTGPGSVDLFTRRVVRVSMGAAFRLPTYECAEIVRDLLMLRERGRFELAATVLSADALPLSSFTRGRRLAILLGNEASGLDAELVKLCDRKLTIPMSRNADSLNVSVAAGIILHQVLHGPRCEQAANSDSHAGGTSPPNLT